MTLLPEWPLVLFTLAVQTAVGIHLALLATETFHRWGKPSEHCGTWNRRPRLLVGVLMVVALIISFLHLGTPVNGLRTLANLDRSWLSREILAALLFFGFWALAYRLGGRRGLASRTRRALASGTGLVGIVLIWVMARIYMVPARPLWDHWLTAADFFLTALLLGSVTLFVLGEDPPMVSGRPGSLSMARAALLPAGFAVAMAQMAVTLAHPLTWSVMTYPEGPPLVALRLLLLLSGALFLTIPLVRHPGSEANSPKLEKPGLWPYLALLCLGASEVVGRMLFYAVGTVNPF